MAIELAIIRIANGAEDILYSKNDFSEEINVRFSRNFELVLLDGSYILS